MAIVEQSSKAREKNKEFFILNKYGRPTFDAVLFGSGFVCQVHRFAWLSLISFSFYAIHTSQQQSISLLMETLSLLLPMKKKKQNFFQSFYCSTRIIIALVKRFTKDENCKLDVLLSRFIYFPFFNTFFFASSGKKKATRFALDRPSHLESISCAHQTHSSPYCRSFSININIIYSPFHGFQC